MLAADQLDTNLLGWAFAFGLFALQVRCWVLRKRCREMIQLGDELDVEFDRRYNDDARRCLRATKFGAKHSNGQICNAMSSIVEETQLIVFDYHYFVRTPCRQDYGHRQTIAALLPTRENFPDFQMRPKRAFEKVGVRLGMRNIAFAEHPQFSSQYVLQADHEKFIRHFFDSSILEFFAERPGWWVESSRRGLVLYKKRRVLNPDEIKEAMTIAVQAFELFEAQGSRLLSHELSEVKGLSCMYWLPEAAMQPQS